MWARTRNPDHDLGPDDDGLFDFQNDLRATYP
jgi:hypothetical protein